MKTTEPLKPFPIDFRHDPVHSFGAGSVHSIELFRRVGRRADRASKHTAQPGLGGRLRSLFGRQFDLP